MIEDFELLTFSQRHTLSEIYGVHGRHWIITEILFNQKNELRSIEIMILEPRRRLLTFNHALQLMKSRYYDFEPGTPEPSLFTHHQTKNQTQGASQ